MASIGTYLTRPLTIVRGSSSPTSTCSTYRLRGKGCVSALNRSQLLFPGTQSGGYAGCAPVCVWVRLYLDNPAYPDIQLGGLWDLRLRGAVRLRRRCCPHNDISDAPLKKPLLAAHCLPNR